MRPSISWLLPGAVVAVGLFAGLDAIRSSGGEATPSAPSATEAATTQTEIVAEVESSELQYFERPGKLTRGRVTTGERFEPVVTFRIPPGWYGGQSAIGFVIGEGPLGEFGDLLAGTISVYVLNLSFAQAARSLETEKVRGIRIRSVSPVRIGGYSGREYVVRIDRPVMLFDAQVFETRLEPDDANPILLDVRGKTLLIQRAFTNDQDRAEIERVITSFRFPQYAIGSPEQEIEQTGNDWAQLFAGDRHWPACQHMSQPACERIACVRVGGFKIRNCTPLSSAFRKSFEGATVQRIAIKGRRAAARFSNGQLIELAHVQGLGGWAIVKLGRNAGRQFFE